MAASTNGTKTPDKKKAGEKKPQIERGGKKILIPDGMGYLEAAESLKRQHEEEQKLVNVAEAVRAFPLDGAVALMRVLQRRYGWANLEPTPGFFGDRPPAMISVETGPDSRVQVPWGNMTVPGVEGVLTTGFKYEEKMPLFVLNAQVKRKDEHIVAAIAGEVREEVRANSIYKGKAVRISFRDDSGDRIEEFEPGFCPKFIDPKVGEEPIFSDALARELDTNLFNPVRHTQKCRDNGVSLKRGVLLTGPYGGGKSLCMFVAAKECVAHGWTFVYLEDVRDLDLAIAFGRLYGPTMVAGEDIDRAVTGPRSPEIDRVLNTIDGIESKNKDVELIVVLTTNHLGAINPAFIRPGRIDAVIEVMPPDETAVARIVRRYATDGGCTVEGSDAEIAQAVRPLLGANAAFFRVVVDRAKLASIASAEKGKPVHVSLEALAATASGMEFQAKLINPEHGRKPLAELEGSEEVHPAVMIAEVGMQMLAEKFVDQVTDPKKLSVALKKTIGKTFPGLKRPPGLN